MKSSQNGVVDRFRTLQPQEVILGLFGEYVGPKEQVWSGGLVDLQGDLGFLAPAARVALNRVVARGLLRPVKDGRFVHYVITPRLQVILDEGRQRTFPATADVEWTGQWTVVWYTVPEKHRLERTRFGRWLSLRGFGSLQDGTWISPGNSRGDVASLAKRLGLTSHVVIFVGDIGEGADVSPIVDQAWKIGELGQMFDIFLGELRQYLNSVTRLALTDREAFVVRTRMIEMFRTLMTMDPKIPDEILGIEWRRREAIEVFIQLQAELFQAANRHFRSLAMSDAL